MDVEDAYRVDLDVKTINELNEDIMDALGLRLPKGKEIQSIYSGY